MIIWLKIWVCTFCILLIHNQYAEYISRVVFINVVPKNEFSSHTPVAIKIS